MPPPAKNFLTPEQDTQLQQALKENELAYVRERILIILLQNDGKTHQKISRFWGCSRVWLQLDVQHQAFSCKSGKNRASLLFRMKSYSTF
jgi:hypothetical protein